MSFATSILAWLHGIITSFHNRLAALEGKAGVQTPDLEVHPDVAAAAANVAGAAPPVQASQTVSAAIDYSKYETAYAAIAAHPQGLPPEWSWDAWMAAHPGQPDPRTHTNTGASTEGQAVDHSGFDLVAGGDVRVNSVTANATTPRYRFSVSKSPQRLRLFGAPGNFFSAATVVVYQAGSDTSIATISATVSGDVADVSLSLSPGSYEATITPNGSGQLATQYQEGDEAK